MLEGILAGIAVSGINGAISWWIIQWGRDKEFSIFVKIFLAAMFGRFVLVVSVSLLLLLGIPSIHRGGYLVALVAFFVLIQVLEIVVLLRRSLNSTAKSEKND